MAGVSNDREIKIRKVNDSFYLVGDGQTEISKENPPLAPRVMTCAALMASIALENVSNKC